MSQGSRRCPGPEVSRGQKCLKFRAGSVSQLDLFSSWKYLGAKHNVGFHDLVGVSLEII